MRASFFAVLSLCVVLAGCQKPQAGTTVPPPPAPAATAQDEGGAYHPDLADFTYAVLHDGRKKVLFFHASWCPICRRTDTQLQELYAADEFPLSVYKLDYDKEKSFKLSYGVTYQHTFVIVDGDGKMLRRLEAPSLEKLKQVLGEQV